MIQSTINKVALVALVAMAMFASLFVAATPGIASAADAPDGYSLALCGTLDLPGANDVTDCNGPYYVDSTGTILVDDDGEIVRPVRTGFELPEDFYENYSAYTGVFTCNLTQQLQCANAGTDPTYDHPSTRGVTHGNLYNAGPDVQHNVVGQPCATLDFFARCVLGPVSPNNQANKDLWAALRADNPANGGPGLFGGGINEGAAVIVDGVVVSGDINNGLPR